MLVEPQKAFLWDPPPLPPPIMASSSAKPPPPLDDPTIQDPLQCPPLKWGLIGCGRVCHDFTQVS